MRSTLYAKILLATMVVLFTASTVFVPTIYALGENTSLLWVKVNQNGFGSTQIKQIFALEEFKGAIYAGASATDGTIAIWKSPDGRTWTKINQLTPTATPVKNDIMDLHEYNGYLYAATAWTNPAQVWRSFDGLSWERINDSDFGSVIEKFTVFYSDENNLYVSNFRNIYVSTTGASDSWDRVISLPDEPKYDGIWSITKFNDYLYAGGQNNTTGVKIYRVAADCSWTVTNLPGFKSAPENLNNTEIGGFAVFHNELYTGTLNMKTGGEIWKTADGKNWSLVMEGGFGDVSNEKVEAFVVYNDQLIVAVNNPTNGIQIWSSVDGTTWTKIKDARYDPPLNRITHWNNAILSIQNKLYLGTFNSISGAEIWSYPNFGLYIPTLHK